MRQIKFRGLRTDGEGWVYGYYYKLTESQNYIMKGLHQWNVTPESVGQFTGLKDKNGKEIYEGDLIKVFDPYTQRWSVDSENVFFSNKRVGGWVISNGQQNLNLGTRQNHLEVTGTIHDGKEER